ncbi:MAG: hypothetical protein IT473_16570 [Lysobacter sp.]|nr:hypothetical protein [Lysobacter sp.]
MPTVEPAGTEFGFGCAGSAMLAPANDTRLNLALLLADRHGTAFVAQPPKTEPLQRPILPMPFSWATYASRVGRAGEGEDASWTILSGQGTPCVSTASGEAQFIAALNADKSVPADEKARLADARRNAACTDEGTAAATDALDADLDAALSSKAGREFLAYWRAAVGFYNGAYDPAPFVALAKSKQPWVREASRYMIGRAWALAAQARGFGEYGDIEFEGMDRAALGMAEAALKAYVRDYPRGQYTASAYGLMRRVYWLGQDQDKLLDAYRWQIDQTDASLRNLTDIDLAQEIDAKLPADAYRADKADPLLLAVDDLRRMRAIEGSPGEGGLSRDALLAQRSRFARAPELFEYLLAAHAYFVEKSPERVLSQLPDAAPKGTMSTVQFSRQALRALALDAMRDAQAREAWLRLFPHAQQAYQRETLQLGLALHDQRGGTIPRLFEANSPVVDPAYRERMLMNLAGPDLLRARVKDTKASSRERAVAAYVLLYKQLTRGRYADFLTDAKTFLPKNAPGSDGRYFKLEQAPPLGDFAWGGTAEGYRCPSLQTVAATLAKTPNNVAASLCLGEFVRLKGYDAFELDFSPSANELGGGPSQFPGESFSRQRIYRSAMNDAAATPEDKAYALYRAVNCYAPSGNNDCGGEEVPKETRKAWFRRLKSEYASSPWAKKLEFYW